MRRRKSQPHSPFHPLDGFADNGQRDWVDPEAGQRVFLHFQKKNGQQLDRSHCPFREENE